jgi:hypothetical protein
MKRNILLIAGLFLAGFLAACGSEPAAQLPVVAAAEEAVGESSAPEETTVLETAVDEQGAISVAGDEQAADDESTVLEQTAVLETAVDEQGAVTVAVTPSDLSQEATTLAFEVTMNTHSVDLGMDLAELATLTTDNGRTVSATLWDAVPGGHHVSGVLTFPVVVEGTAVLEGAAELTVTITNVDAPSRTFTWLLSQ